MSHLEQIQGEYFKFYPSNVATSAATIQGADTPAPVGAHLELCLTYLTTTLLVVGATMADRGDSDAAHALSAIRQRYSTKSSSGEYLAYFDIWNDYESTRAIFDADDVVPLDVAPTSTQFAHLWKRLVEQYGKADGWDFAVITDERLRETLSTTPSNASEKWVDLVTPLVQWRNKFLHKGLGAQHKVVPPLLVTIARAAVLEIAVKGPPAQLLGTTKLGAKCDGGEDPTRGWYYEWETQTSIRRIRTSTLGVATEHLPNGEQWVLRLEEQSSTDPMAAFDTPWGTALGRWRTDREILNESKSRDSVPIEARAEAQLTAGIVDIRTVSGGVAFLPLPTNATVSVTARGRSASNINDLRIDKPFGWDPSTDELVRATVRETLKSLAESLEPGDARVVPTGMSGSIQVLPSTDTGALHIELRRAIVLATARAIARSLVDRLPNDVQERVLANVLGSDSGAHRDFYGWVDSATGRLVGSAMSCPAADLLLLAPSVQGQRRRAQRLPSHLGTDDSSDLSTFEGLVARSTRTAELLDLSEPHPLLPLVVPMCAQFGAEGVFSAHDSWNVGLIFRQNDPQLALAVRYLERRRSAPRLPRSIKVIQVSTAATDL